MSATTAVASRPLFLISATRVSNSLLRRALATTFAPRQASSRAVARPMPELAPVTNATLSARVLGWGIPAIKNSLIPYCGTDKYIIRSIIIQLSAFGTIAEIHVCRIHGLAHGTLREYAFQPKGGAKTSHSNMRASCK